MLQASSEEYSGMNQLNDGDFDGDHEWASEWEIAERDFREELDALPTAKEHPPEEA